MMLLDMGARVIKVERPDSGDDSRAIGPFLGEMSSYFMTFNRGKESIALDLKAADDRAVFERLLACADVLIENFRPGAMEKIGYGFEAVHARFPKLIYTSVSGFGHTGPYKNLAAYDLVAQAMGGIMSLTGRPDEPPVRVGASIGDMAAGLFATIGIQNAVIDRMKTGLGQFVDIAMLDCQVALLENAVSRYFATGQVPGPIGTRHPTIAPFQAFKTADDYIVVAVGNDELFARLVNLLGLPHLADDPRFQKNADRAQHVDLLEGILTSVFETLPAAHWLGVLQEAGIPRGPINSVDKVLADPQVVARNMVAFAEQPDGTRLGMSGNPVKLSAYPQTTERPPAPDLDADRAAVMAFLDEAEAAQS